MASMPMRLTMDAPSGGSSSMKIVALVAAAAAAGAFYFKSKHDRYPSVQDVTDWVQSTVSGITSSSSDAGSGSGSGDSDAHRDTAAPVRARLARNRRLVAAESAAAMNGGASTSMFVTAGPTGHPTAIGQRQLPGDALIGSVSIRGQSLGNKPIFKPAGVAAKRGPHKYTGIGGASTTLAPPVYGESGWVDMAIPGEVTKNVSWDLRGDPTRTGATFEPPVSGEPSFGPAVDVPRPARNVVNDRAGAPSLQSALTRFE